MFCAFHLNEKKAVIRLVTQLTQLIHLWFQEASVYHWFCVRQCGSAGGCNVESAGQAWGACDIAGCGVGMKKTNKANKVNDYKQAYLAMND